MSCIKSSSLQNFINPGMLLFCLMIADDLKKNFLSGVGFDDIIGQDDVKQHIKSALLMNRHIIIVGPPGVGKTTLAKGIAKLLPDADVVKGCSFNCSPDLPICPKCKSQKNLEKIKAKGVDRFIRVQGSPDLTVEDLLGDIDPIKALKFGPLSLEAFTPGKIFKANRGILFFDEINRAPEKLQNALLEVLQESTATIGSYDVNFPTNFVFIGTMNPEDFAATEPLSEVFLDRFDLVYMGYPESLKAESEIVSGKSKILTEITFPENLLQLLILFIRNMRRSDDLEKKPSVRASIGLFERAQSNALLKAKSVVELEDIKDSIVSVLAHRIRLKPSIRYSKGNSEFVNEELKEFLNTREAEALVENKEGGAG